MSKPIERTVEIITKAFPGGAQNEIERDDEKNVEVDGVRPSMIVYGMRWWFRALAGAVLGTTDLERIRTAESAIFGTAQNITLNGQKFEGLSSRVRVAVIEPIEIRDIESFNERDWGVKLKYLAYGLFPTDSQDTWVRKYVKEGAKFKFRLLVAVSRHKSEPEISDELIGSLANLWIKLGGLGARWRHGLGGMRNHDEPELKDAEQYGQRVNKEIGQARELVKAFLKSLGLVADASSDLLAMPSFPVAAHPHLQMLWESNSDCGTAMMALEKIHTIWRGTRLAKSGGAKQPSSLNRDLYDLATRSLATGHAAKFAGLGLPIPFGFPQIGPHTNGALMPSKSSRRASPIWFRVVRVSSTKYRLLVMLWNCEYLPDGEGVVVQMMNGSSEPVVYAPGEAVAWFNDLPVTYPSFIHVRG